MTQLSLGLDKSSDGESVSETANLAPKKRKSMRAAINAYCFSCGYDPLDKGAGNWRQQIMACQARTCELWELRPVSKPRKVGEVEVESDDLDMED